MTNPIDSDNLAESGTPEPAPEHTVAPHIDAVRELVLRAHPNVVPELVRGETLDDLLASIEPASAAYTNLATRFERPSVDAPEPVPAGATLPAPIDIERIPTAEKLRRGIGERLRQSR